MVRFLRVTVAQLAGEYAAKAPVLSTEEALEGLVTSPPRRRAPTRDLAADENASVALSASTTSSVSTSDDNNDTHTPSSILSVAGGAPLSPGRRRGDSSTVALALDRIPVR